MGTGIGIGWGQGFGWGQDGDGDGNMDGDRMGMGMRMRTWMGTGWGRCIWKGTRSGGRKALLLAVLCWRPMSPALRVRVRTLSPAPGGHAGVVSPPGAMQVSCPPLGTCRCHAGWESRGWEAGEARATLCHAVPCQVMPCHAVPHRAVPCRQAGSPYCWGSGASTFLAAFSPDSGDLEQGPAGK